MRRTTPGRLLAAPLLFLALVCAAAAAPQKVASVEGVTEYRLDNGLRVLTVPDPSVDTLTVHVVYLVGSRQEGYGERGMAHLLEHMLFKGSKKHPDIKQEFTARGARWNGTTSNDRTNYFETVSASDANLDWAIELEADRMVNSRVSRQDLDSEMTVVRNEFEMGENNPGSVLFERMQELAYVWHNYGHPIIGERTDIEKVPIDKLQAFYRAWYQPDNAVLILGGRFDDTRALALVQKYFGALPRPSRKLPDLYTQEPTQDGERDVTLRRVGDNPLVSTLYRVAAGSDPGYPAIDVLVQVLGDVPSGRLHRALVQKGLAAASWGAERGLHDPGFAYFGAQLPAGADPVPARDALIAVVEGVAKQPVTADEVERARTRLLNDFEKVERDSGQLVSALSEFSAIGDWRLFFLYRDRLRKVTVADVQQAAEHYFKQSNRVLGVFVPTAQPDRAVIPPPPDVAAEVKDYHGGGTVALGERFDPSPQNIEKRVVRSKAANGIDLALLPKQTRGSRVIARLGLHYGDEKALTNRDVACELAGAMLTRGTKERGRAEFKEALEKLNATVSISAEGASIDVRRENLVPALRLVAEALREPAFAQSEFDELKRAVLAGTEAQRSDPSVRAEIRLERHLQVYPPGHPLYTPTVEERLKRVQAATLADAQSCYGKFFGATGAEFVAVGDFARRRRAVRALALALSLQARAAALLRAPAARQRDPHARQGERRAARRAEREDARRRSGLPGAAPRQLSARRLVDGAPAGAHPREGRALLQHLLGLQRKPVRSVGELPRRGHLRAAEPCPSRASDARGDRARRTRRLRRRRGRGRQEGAPRGAAPAALAGPGARGAPLPLRLRRPHLRLGHRPRVEDRQAHPAGSERDPSQVHRPREARHRHRRRLQEIIRDQGRNQQARW
jgi:zinc protease